jgi:hypothetical protein
MYKRMSGTGWRIGFALTGARPRDSLKTLNLFDDKGVAGAEGQLLSVFRQATQIPPHFLSQTV